MQVFFFFSPGTHLCAFGVRIQFGRMLFNERRCEKIGFNVYINGEPLLRFEWLLGDVHTSERARVYHSQEPDSLCALGHKYHRLFIYYTANARHSMQECCLFPIQLPSNTFAQHAFNAHWHSLALFGGVKQSVELFLFPSMPAKYKYKYKQVAYSLCFNRIMDTACARDTHSHTHCGAYSLRFHSVNQKINFLLRTKKIGRQRRWI